MPYTSLTDQSDVGKSGEWKVRWCPQSQLHTGSPEALTKRLSRELKIKGRSTSFTRAYGCRSLVPFTSRGFPGWARTVQPLIKPFSRNRSTTTDKKTFRLRTGSTKGEKNEEVKINFKNINKSNSAHRISIASERGLLQHRVISLLCIWFLTFLTIHRVGSITFHDGFVFIWISSSVF